MSEYIDREAFLKDAETRYCLPCKGAGKDYNGVKCRACWVDDMMGEVDYAPAEDVAPVVWIPVTDRLPEVDTKSKGCKEVTVIATNGKFVRPLIYERAIVRGKVVRRWKWLWDRIYDGNPVTHWMPLPEPPKMEGGTKNAAD